jgi:hypothetical protein
MAKKFYYDSMGLNDLTASGAIKAGTFNPSTNVFSPSDSEITDEHVIKDQSLSKAVTSFDDEDMIRIDFTTSRTASAIARYNNSGSEESNDMLVYRSSDPTDVTSNGGSISITLDEMVAGWDVDEFTEVSERYWFLRSEDGQFSGLSEVILGVPLTFENEPDIGVATQEIFATDLNTSLGGVEYANKRHEPKTTWQLNFSNISQTFKNNLVSFEQDVTNFKKFVYYDDSSYHYVRLDSPIKFTEVAFERFSASLKLREQLS